MGNILLVALALAGLALPGFTWWQWWSGRDSGVENLAKAFCFGLGIAVLGLYLLAFAGLNVALIVWACLIVASLFLWFSKRDGLKGLFSGEHAATKWLLGVLFATAVLRFIPTFFEPNPRGWDPWAHLLLIQEMLFKDGHVYNWLPYEDIPLRYPTGSHLLVALIARVTGIEPHFTFNIMLVWVSLLTCLQVYSLAMDAAGNRDLALITTGVYCLLPIAGSIGYYAWGGLPNLVGIYLLLGAVGAFISRPADNRLSLILFLYFISICLVHEHALLVSLAVFLAFGVRCLRTADQKRTTMLLKAAVPAMVAGALYHYFHDPRGYSMAETGFLIYREELHTPSHIMNTVGGAFVTLCLLGAWVFFRRREEAAVNPFFLWMTASMLVCFVLFEYGSRLVTPLIYNESFAPATPARFLTDAVVPLSLFAGILLWSVQRMLGCGLRPVMTMIALLGVSHHWLYASYRVPEVQPAAAEAYAWVRENTPPETRVLGDRVEVAYFCRRVCSNAPFPSSELWAHTVNRKRLNDIAISIFAGKIPEHEMKEPYAMIVESGMATVVFNRFQKSHPGFLQPVWQTKDGSYTVLAIHPGAAKMAAIPPNKVAAPK